MTAGADGSAGNRRIAARPAWLTEASLLGSIVGSNLIVALGQYRVVEDGLEKVVEPS